MYLKHWVCFLPFKSDNYFKQYFHCCFLARWINDRKIKLAYFPTKRWLENTSTHLCKHGLSILGDHGALITVKRDKVIMEGLLGVLQHIVEFSGATLKYTSEVPWNQRPANCFRGGDKEGESGQNVPVWCICETMRLKRRVCCSYCSVLVRPPDRM